VRNLFFVHDEKAFQEESKIHHFYTYLSMGPGRVFSLFLLLHRHFFTYLHLPLFQRWWTYLLSRVACIVEYRWRTAKIN